MGGFSAISVGNGWLIAALGISVVFFGLVSLAVMISYFPRAIAWWNGLAQTPKNIVPSLKGFFSYRKTEDISPAAFGESHEPGDLDDTEEALRLIAAHMGEPFKLPRLIEIAEKRGLARVHSTINRMLGRGTMAGGPDGLFRWATASDNKTTANANKDPINK